MTYKFSDLIDTALDDRLEGALTILDKLAPRDAHVIIIDLFDYIYHALKRDRYFAHLTHDLFDELTAGVREEIYQDLRDRLDDCVHFQDIERTLKREFGKEDYA